MAKCHEIPRIESNRVHRICTRISGRSLIFPPSIEALIHSAASLLFVGAGVFLMVKKGSSDNTDPYYLAAILYAGFLCESCHAYCSGNPEGTLENQGVSYEEMARVARRGGWSVILRGNGDDFRVLCPSCRGTDKPGAV
jgi:hypothetical protein